MTLNLSLLVFPIHTQILDNRASHNTQHKHMHSQTLYIITQPPNLSGAMSSQAHKTKQTTHAYTCKKEMQNKQFKIKEKF